jgi:hypothetical protein
MSGEYIDVHGTPHRSSTDFEPVARQTKTTCFILASLEGVVFNPNDPTMDRFEKDKMRGSLLFKLQRCTRECYASYKQFLKTKNRTHLIVTERRFLNG